MPGPCEHGVSDRLGRMRIGIYASYPFLTKADHDVAGSEAGMPASSFIDKDD